MACPSLHAGASFVSAMLRFVDCEAQTIGASGYQALAAPGSVVSLALTGLLTLFIALFGYRMILGHVPTVRDGVLAMVKIGVVLTMATSWPAYRTLIYDVAIREPAELAAVIGGAANLPGARSGLVSRLEYADSAFTALAIAGTGPSGLQQAAQQVRVPPAFVGFDAFAFGGARMLFLFGAIGAFASVRIVAGILLALAPLFFAFLLFDGTRGLFEGWLRALLGATLGALGISVVLALELKLIEPWLIELLSIRAAGDAIFSAPVELLVVTSIFCLILAAWIYAAIRIAMGFRFPSALPFPSAEQAAPLFLAASPAAPSGQGTSAEERSRATVVADAVAASQRREAAWIAAAVAQPQPRSAPQPRADMSSNPASLPLGQSFRRRTMHRVSASAGRRDTQS